MSWRPPVGSPVRVTIPDGRTVDTLTCSEVFYAPPLVAVYGVRDCVPLEWVGPLPPGTAPLDYEEHQGGPFGTWRAVRPRWGRVDALESGGNPSPELAEEPRAARGVRSRAKRGG